MTFVNYDLKGLQVNFEIEYIAKQSPNVEH